MTDPNALLVHELPYARFLVLELAAMLDRLSRPAAGGGSSPLEDPRCDRLREAVRELTVAPTRDNRAETILRLLSDA